jgi:hypothetical protein
LKANDISQFCEKGLQFGKHLVFLDLSFNNLGSEGIYQLFEKGIKFNKSILYLDLFNVNFGNHSL